MKTLIMRLDHHGQITEMSAEAIAFFGCVEGQECARVVQARALNQQPLCRIGCVTEGWGPGSVEEPHGLPVSVQGRLGRLTCTSLGRGHAVSLELTARGRGNFVALTPREREVLAHVAEGRTTRQIAGRLRVSQATIRTHIEHARDKLGANTRAEAVRSALLTRQIS